MGVEQMSCVEQVHVRVCMRLCVEGGVVMHVPLVSSCMESQSEDVRQQYVAAGYPSQTAATHTGWHCLARHLSTQRTCVVSQSAR